MTPPTPPDWVVAVARPAVRAWLRLDVRGAHHVPRAGGVLLAAHHVSNADVLALGAASPRPVTYFGSTHVVEWPVIGPLLPRLGMVPVERGEADLKAMQRFVQLLEEGAALVVFPQGSRSPDGHVYRPRSGVTRLAAAASCPTVPVGIIGTAAVWPVGQGPRLRRGRVRIRFGVPLEAPKDEPGARRGLADRLHAALAELSQAPRADGFLRRDDG